jgi:hypothetical protein
MRTFAEHRKAQTLANPVKSAAVAPQPVHVGFARMFQTLNEHPQITIEIFSSLRDAPRPPQICGANERPRIAPGALWRAVWVVEP